MERDPVQFAQCLVRDLAERQLLDPVAPGAMAGGLVLSGLILWRQILGPLVVAAPRRSAARGETPGGVAVH
ncbi:MAG: hypothetical protein ACREJ5_04355 [Geminicoccaceae bacterium]